MPAPISWRSFSGEVPRVPAELLPDTAAQYAIDVDLSSGHLSPLKAPFLLRNMVNTVRGLFTDNGLTFFTWATDTDAIKSPVVADQFGRVYYTTGTDFRVTQNTLAAVNGGEPSSSWRAGVPKGATLTAAVVNSTTLPDNTLLEWKFFYEANGIKYQEQPISPTTVTVGREYSFTAPQIVILQEGEPDDPPDEDTYVVGQADAFKATPANALPCVSVRGINPTTGAEVFHAYSSNSSFSVNDDTTRFNGLAVEIAANLLTGTVTVKFTYGSGFLQTRAFVYTAVNIFGEEGAPSDPVLLSYDIMQYPRLQIIAALTGPYVPIAKYKVYATVTASTGDADYQFVQDIAYTGGNYFVDITTKPENWGASIETKSHLPPPVDLKGLTLLNNGIAVGFRGREIWFAQPYKPWAWRPQDTLTLPFGIVSILAHSSQLIVTTTANPYVVSGLLPESMSETKLNAIQAGVSKNSLVSCGAFAAYATNDGICTITANQASMDMSFSKFTRKTWQAMYGLDLANLKLAFHDGALIGYFENRDGFIWRFDEAGGQFCQSSTRGAAGFMLPQTDSLYLAQGAMVLQYQGGADLTTGVWQSREVHLPTPGNFGAARIVCNGEATVLVYADGLLRHVEAVNGSKTFRLPAGFDAETYKVAISLKSTIQQFHFGETCKSLARV